MKDGVMMPKRSRKILYDGGGGEAKIGSKQGKKGGEVFEMNGLISQECILFCPGKKGGTKHGTRLYNLEKLDIPHKVSQAVDEIVTDAVDWAMQAPLRARFRDLPTVDMKEILQQRMQEAHKKRQKRRDAPRSPPGSPPSQPPPPPPPAGASGALVPSSSKTTASAQQSMAWTTSDTRYESTGIAGAQKLSPSDDLMHDDSVPDEQIIIHLQFQMEECHKMLTDQVDWANPKGDQVRINVNRPLPLGGPPGHVTIQTEFFFNKDMEYLRFGNKGSMPDSPSNRKEVVQLRILSVSRIKASHDTDKWMLSTAVKLWTRNLVIRQRGEDFQLGIKSYQTQLNLTKPGWDATGYEFKHDYTIIESPRAVISPVNNNERNIMRFNKIYKFSDGTLTRILEKLDYRVKEFKIKRLNPGMNTRFWTKKDVTRSKEFITAIERRLKTRRIYRNLECFVGGRVRDIDYMLLQRTELYHHSL
ncbi:hypothetical protein Tco_1104287 [Tanacetum coccineum]